MRALHVVTSASDAAVAAATAGARDDERVLGISVRAQNAEACQECVPYLFTETRRSLSWVVYEKKKPPRSSSAINDRSHLSSLRGPLCAGEAFGGRTWGPAPLRSDPTFSGGCKVLHVLRTAKSADG